MSKRPLRVRLSPVALKVIGIPKKFYNVDITKYDTYGDEDLEQVKDFISDYISDIDKTREENKGLFLCGSNGVGKTMIASIILKEAYRWRYSAKRVYFQDYVEAHTRLWNIHDAEERENAEVELYTEYNSVDFLCIEEIGKEVDMSVTASILEHLLRYREDNSLPTIICTNLDIDAVAERYGNSVASLVKGNTTPVLIEGKDKRSNYYKQRTTQS